MSVLFGSAVCVWMLFFFPSWKSVPYIWIKWYVLIDSHIRHCIVFESRTSYMTRTDDRTHLYMEVGIFLITSDPPRHVRVRSPIVSTIMFIWHFPRIKARDQTWFRILNLKMSNCLVGILFFTQFQIFIFMNYGLCLYVKNIIHLNKYFISYNLNF